MGTVGDLRRMLEGYPDETEVILSCDGEGNGFSPLYTATPAYYEAETPYRGEIFGDEEAGPDDVLSLVLWPVA